MHEAWGKVQINEAPASVAGENFWEKLKSMGRSDVITKQGLVTRPAQTLFRVVKFATGKGKGPGRWPASRHLLTQSRDIRLRKGCLSGFKFLSAWKERYPTVRLVGQRPACRRRHSGHTAVRKEKLADSTDSSWLHQCRDSNSRGCQGGLHH